MPDLLADPRRGVSGQRFGGPLPLSSVTLPILGCMMDMAAPVLITTLLFLPLAQEAGMDPAQFGMVMVMMVTMIDPGLGLTLPRLVPGDGA